MLFGVAVGVVTLCPPVRAEAPATASPTTQPSPIREDPRVRAWWQVMGWGTLLILAFLAGASAIVIFSRRYLEYLTRTRGAPTPNDDVWSMHADPTEEDEAPRGDDDA